MSRLTDWLRVVAPLVIGRAAVLRGDDARGGFALAERSARLERDPMAERTREALAANKARSARLGRALEVHLDTSAAIGWLDADSCVLDGDRSACELSSVFARGVMDLGAATAPVGETSITLGGRVADGGAPARSSGLVSGRAMGDALGRDLAGRGIAVFDTLGAPFWTDAAGFAADAAPPDPAAQMSGWLAGMDGAGTARSASGEGGPVLAILAGPAENGLEVGPGGPEGAHLGLASRPVAAGVRLGNTVVSAFASTVPGGDAGAHGLDADTHGAVLSWSAAAGRTSLRAGLVRECAIQ